MWSVEENYGSTFERAEQIQRQFVEEAAEGMMVRMPRSEAQVEWGNRLRIASSGDIQKSDGSLRIHHDGTHGGAGESGDPAAGSGAHSGIGEEKVVQIDLPKRGTTAFGLKADVSKAHRRFKLIREDWGLIACEVVPGEVWLNTVGFFGLASSNYWLTDL